MFKDQPEDGPAIGPKHVTGNLKFVSPCIITQFK